MTFGELVAALGAAELLALLLVLAAMLTDGAPSARLEVRRRAPREKPRKVEEAA